MRPGGLRRTSWAALAGLVGGTALLATASPAHADITVSETYARPSGGVFKLLGHGWGHGHGMSQYGAQGAATLGNGADYITSTYYPNTKKLVQPNTSIRIKLSTDSRTTTREFLPATGQVMTDGTGTSRKKIAVPTTASTWRVTSDSAGLHVSYVTSGGTTKLAPTYAGPIEVYGTTFIRIRHSDGSSRDYRSRVRVQRSGTSSLTSIAIMPMESYLYGVVPRESPSSFAPAALQAQAIAARSYSTYKRDHAAGSSDICDTTQCQVFQGSAKYTAAGTKTNLEATSTTSAVNATAGVIRTYDGAAIFAEFSASNGGWSTDGGQPYLVAKPDPWDGVTGSSVHSWTASLPVSSLESYFSSRGLGTFRTLTITRRDGNGEWGGRVLEVVLRGVDSSGNATSVTTTGSGIYNARPWTGGSSTGLRSRWFWIVPEYSSSVVSRSAAPRLVLPPGYPKGTLTAVFRNTGNAGWPVSGLHLALASPAGGKDPLVGGSTRPGSYVKNLTHPGATTVLPGDQAQFAVPVDASHVPPGTRTTSYRVRIGAAAIFGATASWTLDVQAPRYTASQAAPPSLVTSTYTPPTADSPVLWADKRTVVVPRNGSTTLRLTAENTGNFSWAVGSTTPIQLGTSGPRDRASVSVAPSWLSSSRVSRLSAPSTVAAGKTGTFDLQLAGNSKPTGVTTESFEPVFSGRSWISGDTTTLTVVRVEPRVGRAALPELAPATGFTLANAPTGSRWLTVRLRNVGGQAWEVGKEQLGTSSAYALASGWTSGTRTPPLRANLSRPGATTVAPGEVGEWMVKVSAYKHAAGTYATTLRAVGPSGFYGPSFPVSVKVANAAFTYEYVGKTGTVTVPSTGLAYAWFDIRNTSNFVWPVGGSLRSTVLAATSPSQATSWYSPSRPGPLSFNLTTPGLTYVRAGEVARFRVLLAGNGRTPRTTSERFGMSYDGWRSSPLMVTLPYRIV
jgi:SpoIID/LytB domain protein